MQKTWNYLLFSTWKLQILLGEILIVRPINFIIYSCFPFLRKNKEKGKIEYEKVMYDKKSGFDIGFANRFMFQTTFIIYANLCLYTVFLLNIKIGDKIFFYITLVAVLAYITNYYFLWKSDIYLKYFRKFEKVKFRKINYLYVILFHFGVLIFLILSIHFTYGFNL